MRLKFEKWHGAKNDFILFWLPDDQVVLESIKRQAPQLCSRQGDGIGADGILVLTQSPYRDQLMPQKLTIINSDGSLAVTCGNGIRCAALSVLKRHYDATHKVEIPEAFVLPLSEGEVTCRFLGRRDLNQAKDYWPYVSVDMGVANINEDHPWFSETKTIVQQKAQNLGLAALTRDWSLIGIGNHHLVFFLDDVSPNLIRQIGPEFQKSDRWDGINVHIAAPLEVSDEHRRLSSQHLGQAIEDLYEVYVWERGAGETMACGSGACAVTKSVLESGMVNRSQWVGIKMPGGLLYVKQQEEDDPMTLAGPGALVFTGEIDL